MKIKSFLAVIVSVIVCMGMNAQTDSTKIFIPAGGNSFVTKKAINGNEAVTNDGLKNWQHAATIFSTYIYLDKPGLLNVAASVAVPEGQSKFSCTINGITKLFIATSNKEYAIGTWNIKTAGYIKIDIKGVEKEGPVFGTSGGLIISGTATGNHTAFVKNNEGNYFYWGRRGPSVHLNYDLSALTGDAEWFYNEITVPKGNDITGSYFMANGFAEGYFGMQVNSDSERHILFSVWSPFNTDDPKQIPEDKKITMLKKGIAVHTGEFGNEGSGGQSYLLYNWKAGTTYKFLVHAQPVENNYTNFTAYFYATEKKQWLLLASFSRPATNTYLTKLHSFLENFEPETGYITRKAYYQNQWVKTSGGAWQPINKAIFTFDATAKKEYRLDYSGAGENGKFILRNCGFFNNNTPFKTVFTRSVTGKIPNVDLSKLK